MSKPENRAKRPRKENKAPAGSSRENETPLSPTHAGQPSSDSSYHLSHLQASQHVGSSASAFSVGNPTGQRAVSNSGLAPPPGKIAIPPLRSTYSSESTAKTVKKGRTAHACNNCRKTKAGCTGETPCPRCRNAGIVCQYGDGKREAEKKTLSRLSKETGVLSKQNADLTDALRRIQLDRALSAEGMRAAIDNVLAKTPASSPPEREMGGLSMGIFSPEGVAGTDTTKDDDDDDDDDDNDEVGSTGSVDAVHDDPDREDNRPRGHLGKSSAVAWAQRTADELRKTSSQESSVDLQEADFNLPSYHIEDGDISYVVDEETLDIFEWPDIRLAHELVRNYFAHVHNAFPIIDKLSFESWYTRATPDTSSLSEDETVWLSTLNLIFAIAAYHAHLTNAQHRGAHYDHQVYCARAKKLSMDERLLYRDARLSNVSAMGLQCLYYLATCHINRAWTFCGLAIRQSLTLGLHIRSEAQEVGDVEKEHRIRIWWSLYSLECLLNESTGRPSCISDTDISTPLPINVSEDEFHPGQSLYERRESMVVGHPSRRGSPKGKGRMTATYSLPLSSVDPKPSPIPFPAVPLPVTPSTYFIYRTQLSIISHEIVTQLYCAATVKVRWSEVQDAIRKIDQRLSEWVGKLPREFDMNIDTIPSPNWNDPYFIPQIGLAMFYTSSRMLLFRPFLCRFDIRLKSKNQESRAFNQDAVENCILSAKNMIGLLCWSCSTVDQLYTIPPWWSTIHNICQALSVLILEMAFRSQHMPEDFGEILADAKRGVTWLALMASVSIPARKAWEVFDKLIRLVTLRGNYTVFDLPVVAPMPPGYNWHRLDAPQSDLINTSQPNPLSQANLQQYQHGQGAHLSSDATAMWTTQPASHTSFVGTPSFEPAFSPQDAANPLNPSEALDRFSTMGSIHGLYDEPWQHMFAPLTTQTDIPIYGSQHFDTTPLDQNFNPEQAFGQSAAGGFPQFGQLNTGSGFVPDVDPASMDPTSPIQSQQNFDPNLAGEGDRYRF
ncbi:Zn2/Cys6 DNA-binding protein [Glarea lozoyensis ATCC 20868]|uniref:Zn2/Cys6 DNA-binding protein n=1 Tax=Glarea lozoyensis (strain ATCC 20868 / MF5171) TaxID=1116229 RepID=S3CGA2_GLAL2|nr:Zn2/Cys6 DNA-binding protein [Glarea lozoyensis ATCC 20868]EPE24930.1 Zn2/Cys6 DNA-binding protein [Glarea lozoyensis ATCC 20868]